MDIDDMARHLRRERWILSRPGDVLERDELHHQHAVMRGLRDGEVKFAARTRVAADVMDVVLIDFILRLGDQPAQPRMILGGRVQRGKLGRKALDGALRLHDLRYGYAREVELNGERFRKQPRIALRDAGAAPRANLDIDNPLRFQGT